MYNYNHNSNQNFNQIQMKMPKVTVCVGKYAAYIVPSYEYLRRTTNSRTMLPQYLSRKLRDKTRIVLPLKSDILQEIEALACFEYSRQIKVSCHHDACRSLDVISIEDRLMRLMTNFNGHCSRFKCNNFQINDFDDWTLWNRNYIASINSSL